MKILKLPAASVSARFAAIMLLVLVLPFVALLIVTTGNLSRIQRESANQYLSSNLRTVSATVDQSLKSLEFSHTVIFQDTKFLNAIKRLSPYSEREEYPDFLNTNAIKKRIAESAVTNNYIYSIYAYSFPAQRIFSSKVNWDPKFNYYTGENSEWLQAHLENTKRHPWCITKDINEGKLLISSYREIWDYAMGDSPLGLLSINIDAGVITGMLDEVAPKVPGYTFIIDSKGDIISNQNDSNREVFEQIKKLKPDSPGEGYFSFNIGKGEMFASFYTSPYSGFTYVIATSLNLIQTS
ncbi:MAG: cache domain-containing protein, partial [Clostridiales bacterium]|nr:cache domain-containing protein [Clostridiales bacterium]